MKKTNILVSFLLGVIFIFSCEEFPVGNDFLEKPPSVDVTKDTIFSKLEYADRFLTGAYATLHYGWIYNFSAKGIGIAADVVMALTDLAQSFRLDGGVVTIYYSGQFNPGYENSTANTIYNFLGEDNWVGIRKANIFIENIDQVPDADESTKKRLKAEAKMIIAMHYTDMYRHYGGLPWINKPIGVEDELNFPRMTSIETMDSIIAVIDEAIPDLPWELENVRVDDGRFTKAAAMGLKARLLLFAASPLFNNDSPYLDGEASTQKLTWHGNYDPNLWKRAADVAKDLIDQIESRGGYGLVTTGNARKDFRKAYYERGNGEILISTRVVYKSDNPDYRYLALDLTRGHGIACPTQEYVDLFQMTNGLPITDPSSGYDPNNPYLNRDPRLYESVLVNGDSYQGRKAQLWIGGIERRSISQRQAGSGYIQRKFLLDNDNATSYGSVVQWPYLRLPEIYLSFAEASNEVNNGPTEEAYRCVNIIRNRVNMPDIPRGLNKEEFREVVLNERARELGLEEVRWYDLKRWKKEQDFTKTLHGMNIYKEGSDFTYDLVELPNRYWQDHWSPKWYLSPFPPDEINKDYGLIQNPGW